MNNDSKLSDNVSLSDHSDSTLFDKLKWLTSKEAAHARPEKSSQECSGEIGPGRGFPAAAARSTHSRETLGDE